MGITKRLKHLLFISILKLFECLLCARWFGRLCKLIQKGTLHLFVCLYEEILLSAGGMGERPCCIKNTFNFLCMISCSLNQRFLPLKCLNVKWLTFKRMEPLRSDFTSGNFELGQCRFTYWCILGFGKAWLGKEFVVVLYSLRGSPLLLRLKHWTKWLFCSVWYHHTSFHPCSFKSNGCLTFCWEHKVSSATSFLFPSVCFHHPSPLDFILFLKSGICYLWWG